MRGFLLTNPQEGNGQLANLHISMTTATHFDEMA
jgi:hypothetical protein